ncbi:MAG: hypothetical protein Q4C67_06470 [Deinococcus sp.]|nr:hypothetical protein [Deinococcus sp.]
MAAPVGARLGKRALLLGPLPGGGQRAGADKLRDLEQRHKRHHSQPQQSLDSQRDQQHT